MSTHHTIISLAIIAFAVHGAAAQSAKTFFKHDGPVQAIAFSPDGKLLATGGQGSDQTGEAIIRETATGKQVARLTGHKSAITRLSFASGGKVVAASNNDQLILWDLSSAKILSTTPGVHYLGKHGLAAWNNSLISGWDICGALRFWDLEKKKPRAWRNPGGTIYRPALSDDGEQLAVIAVGNGLRAVVLDLANLRERVSFPLSGLGEMQCLALSPDNGFLAIGSGGGASLWDLRTGALHGVVTRPIDGEGEADT